MKSITGLNTMMITFPNVSKWFFSVSSCGIHYFLRYLPLIFGKVSWISIIHTQLIETHKDANDYPINMLIINKLLFASTTIILSQIKTDY